MSRWLCTPGNVSLLTVLILAAATAGAQTTWYVDDDAPSDPGPGDPTVSDPLENGTPDHPFDAIQEGIDAATDGDTVLMLDGLYQGTGNRDLNGLGRLIIVRSENGRDSCAIDCGAGGHCGFVFDSGESSAAVVQGFTISNGDVGAGDGGGICILSDSNPTVIDCVFSNNSAARGGGLFCSSSAPHIENCIFRENTTTGNGGGMFCGFSANPTVIDCTFENNSGYNGGGMLCYTHTDPSIENCTFTGNTASNRGGAMWNGDYSDPTITGCVFSGNRAQWVGAIQNRDNSSPKVSGCLFLENHGDRDTGAIGDWVSCASIVTNCIFAGNSTGGFGGALGGWNAGNTQVTNCLFYNNSAATVGGALASYVSSYPILTNCTFSDNYAGDVGGAIFANVNCRLAVHNCILWGDLPDEISDAGGGTIDVRFSVVEGGWFGAIDEDPLFVDPGSENYRLSPGSPCIDAAETNDVPPDVVDLDGDGDLDERTPLDLDMNPRFVDDPDTIDTGVADPPDYPEVVDMGAYEFGFCFGDLDGDGEIGLADLAQLLAHYGITSGMAYEDGDLDGDGDVDLGDLASLLAVYGTSC